jgi:large subunit ribosomal protein L9
MKVVFLQDVPNVGSAGQIKEVADGYGRNYLLPKKLALVSTPHNISTVKARTENRAETEKIRKIAEEIDAKELTIKVKMGARDKMHGSITAANIAAELKNLTGQEVDKRKIELEDSIKSLGVYEIAIKLAKDIEPKIKLNIVAKESEQIEEAKTE